MHQAALLTTALALGASTIAQSPLTTLMAGANNGNVGGSVLFNLTVNVPLTITQIDVNCSGISTLNATGSLTVFTTPNTFVGSEANVGAWTQLSSGSLTVGPVNTPTVCVLNPPIALSPGTMGVMLVAGNFSQAYTNGTTGNQNWSNAELTLAAGAAQNVPFTSPTFTPRVFNGAIHYALGSNAASWQAYGTGCNSFARSWYENFVTAAAFDLGGTASTSTCIVQVFTGNSYVVVPSGNQWRTPTGTNLQLPNDGETTRTMPFAMPYPGGITNQLVICSNGYVSLGTSNGTANVPAANLLLTGSPRHCPYWHDLSPATAGSVVYDVDATSGSVWVTWLGVPAGTTGSNTFQIALSATGTVEYRYQLMSGQASISPNVLVGWSPGGSARDPGNRDVSAALPFLTDPTDSVPLRLVASARPRLGTSINLVASAIPTGSPLGVMLFSFTRHDPGLSLSSLGMGTCSQYVGLDATLASVLTGTTLTVPLAIPASTIHIGTLVRCQSATVSPGVNALGVLTSNGVELRLDVQ